ncbi:MAG TPA: TraR/DksA family transcriptional regulator [bacterium]|jgi:RNA polymerase-binding protein DksA|nr:TraR/DksA family transcriptional regulator [bacterium]HOC26153.1 TraR/DksA family transcriptional regulator [bacterium]HOH06252.1 TraR/DksA family transcriptional regulator [bacterium]HOY43488.1 TraR/DksA family transcriptional regulator [bacterium]HPG81683.1 TraR/DksA family transcriptional regulator [bacterium]
MTKEQLAYLKKLIMEKRDRMIMELDHMKSSGLNTSMKETSGDHSSYSFHMADQGTDTMDREQQYFFAARDGNLIYHLNLALERIEKGEFGYCVQCGKEISFERLEAAPHARLCIECKSKEEMSKR